MVATVLERTFRHLPGIGPGKERRLWERGIDSWEVMRSALIGGMSASQLFQPKRRVQMPLFDAVPSTPRQRMAATWLEGIEESRRALSTRSFGFFLRTLNPSDHWRVLQTCWEDAAYLDIETTGLSRESNYATVIGVLHKARFYQWVWTQSLDGLARLLNDVPLVVTFNGARFDLPFLRIQLPFLPHPKAHVDLLSMARSAGIPGGLKDVERRFRIPRPRATRKLSGEDAVLLWFKALCGNRSELRTLLEYNRADVESLPLIAKKLCERKVKEAGVSATARTLEMHGKTVKAGRQGIRSLFSEVEAAWSDRRPALEKLRPLIASRGRTPAPVVIGVDLRGNPARPTGWARCLGANVETAVMFSDEEIIERTLAASPDLVSIDAPLFLPRGRVSVSDDSPCRAVGGIVRDAERVLWSRGIRVYPALIRHMQGLTRRGIEIAHRLRAEGIEVIESYPGAAQDILGIPRKRADVSLLREGLSRFGFALDGAMSHDELDAVTSALVGYYYLADEYEGIGAEDEGFMIVPRWKGAHSWGREIA